MAEQKQSPGLGASDVHNVYRAWFGEENGAVTLFFANQDIKGFLQAIEIPDQYLKQYQQLFDKNGCNTLDVVQILTEDDVCQLIQEVGNRRKIIRGIAKLDATNIHVGEKRHNCDKWTCCDKYYCSEYRMNNVNGCQQIWRIYKSKQPVFFAKK
eukprot:95406_1